MNKIKPQTEKRIVDLGVLVTSQEEKTILDKAKKLGLSKSAFVRLVCLNAKVEASY